MNADDDEHVEPASTALPIITGADGQPYIPAASAIQLLRAIANSCRNLADDPDTDLHTTAAAIDIEADALDTRAIAATGASR